VDELVDAPMILLNVSVEAPVVRGQKSAPQSWPEADASSILMTLATRTRSVWLGCGRGRGRVWWRRRV
jgi:hypothetical protein